MSSNLTIPTLCLLSMAACLPTVAVALPAEGVTWSRTAEPVSNAQRSFACGSLGTFNLGVSRLGRNAEAWATEQPPRYRVPATPTRLSSPRYASSSGVAPGRPWMAVIGSAADDAQRLAAEAETLGLALDVFAWVAGDRRAAVDDAVLLEQLCGVLAAVDAGAEWPLAVVVRLARAAASADAGRCAATGPSTLACQIRAAIDELTRGRAAVIAAGGSRASFPASHRVVLPSRDFSLLAAAGEKPQSFRSNDPNPASIPCLPCIGEAVANGSGTDALLHLEESAPQPEELDISAVVLEVEGELYELDFSYDAPTLGALTAATQATLLLEGFFDNFAAASETYLMFCLVSSEEGIGPRLLRSRVDLQGCADFDDDALGCGENGCAYDQSTGLCRPPGDGTCEIDDAECSCEAFDGSSYACGLFPPCAYDGTSGRCEVRR